MDGMLMPESYESDGDLGIRTGKNPRSRGLGEDAARRSLAKRAALPRALTKEEDPMPKTETERDIRRAAKRALKEAERAGKETRKLAAALPEPAKTKVRAAEKAEAERIGRAKKDASRSPVAARRAARRSSARLERVSVRYGTAGGRASSSDAPRSRRRSKTIKQQRAQVKQPSKMAVLSGFRTALATIMTPTDKEQARTTAKQRVRRMKAKGA
jgi:hypothetical protein